MVPFKLHLILIIISSVGFLFILNLIRKNKLELKFSLIWFFFSLFLLLIGLFPNLSVVISLLFGIETPVNTIFLIVHFGTIGTLFSLTIALSRNHVRNKNLIQEVGLLKQEISELKDKIGR